MIAELLQRNHSEAPKLTRYFCLHDLLQSLGGPPRSPTDVSPQSWAQRLLSPTCNNRMGRQFLSIPAIEHLARRIRWNMARANHSDFLSIEEIREQIVNLCFTAMFESADESTHCFLASKHLPLRTLLNQFDQFKTVWLIRDPRDALVSYFYHDMGVLTAEKLAWFSDNSLETSEQRPWRELFIRDRVGRQMEFYQRSLGFESDQVLLVKYEDLLDSTVDQLSAVCQFLGRETDEDRLRQVADRFAFSSLTNSADEQKDSFVRKASAGEWRKYFTSSDRCFFDDNYCDMLKLLGYEANDEWLERLPEKPQNSFDLNRFRFRSSAIYNGQEYWLRSHQLQVDFPRPFEFDEEPSFFSHLRQTDDRQISDWFARVSCVFDVSGELDQRHDGDQLLGY